MPSAEGHEKEKGRWLLFDAITEVANGRTYEEVANEFLMPKHIKSARKLIRDKDYDRIYGDAR